METGLRLALPGTILFACIWLGFTFRYETQVWGNTVMVHDRWRGTVERCAGGATRSRCLTVLSVGMRPIGD